MSIKPSELNLDQTIQYVASQFEVALNGASAFVDRVGFGTLDSGLLDPYLNPILVNMITNGIVDELELHVRPKDQVSVVRGRDPLAYVIESTVYVSYAVNAPELLPPLPQVIPGFPQLPVEPGVTTPLILSGSWTAKRIAEDLVSRVPGGMSCSYEAPDYYMRENFDVNGSVLEAIQRLVEPFCHFEESKCDIFIDGGVLVIRPRGNGGAGIGDLDAHDARITDLMVRTHFLGYVRVVRLTGSVTGVHTGTAADPGDQNLETVDEMTDSTGTIVSRIITKERKRVLDGAVKSQEITRYEIDTNNKLTIRSRDTVTSDWDDLQLAFPNQIINNPRENLRVIVTESVDPDTGNFQPSSRTSIGHAYGEDQFLRAQNTKKEDWDSDARQWVLAKSEQKQYRDNGSHQYQCTSTQFGADGTPGDVRRTTANGQRPGGPGRSQPSNANTPTTSAVTYATIISRLPGARDFSLTNNNLLVQHLAIIAAQAQQANGSTEVEISFTAAGMPWIRRGQRLHITGLTDDLGYDIPLQEALVSEAKIEYRENNQAPTYLSYVKALYWEH